jgi:hypothetical protein
MKTSEGSSRSSSAGDSENEFTLGRTEAISGELEAKTERIRALLVETSTAEDLRKVLLLNREDLEKIPVALLNSWLVSVPSLRFYKNHGFLALRKTEGKADREALLLSRVGALEKTVERLSRRLEEFAKITNLNTQKLKEVFAFLSGNEGANQATNA